MLLLSTGITFALASCHILTFANSYLQAWQLGVQQGMEQALQPGSVQGEGAPGGLGPTVQDAQERLVLEQMQKLGLFADGSLGPGQLQGVMAMLNKQGMLLLIA